MEDGDDEEDDEDMDDSNTVFGITSAINLTSKSDVGCIQQIRSHVIQMAEKYATDATVKMIRDVFGNDAKHVGFLLNERFVNIPPQISVPLLENLVKEVRRASTKGMPYNFVYYLSIVKFYRQIGKNNKAEDFYTNAEEEMICNGSVCSFEYSVKNEAEESESGSDIPSDDSGMIPYRKIVLFDSKNLPEVITSIKQLIGQ